MSGQREQTERLAIGAAAFLGLEIPEACRPGVIDNLQLLEVHARRLRERDVKAVR